MKTILIATSLFCAFSMTVFAKGKGGFDRPLSHRQWSSKVEGEANHVKTYSCRRFRNFGVYEEGDSWIKGSTDISVYLAKSSKHNPCAAPLSGEKIKLDAQGYFSGMIGDYIFIENDDGLGVNQFLDIFQAKTGNKVFSHLRLANRPPVVVRDGKMFGVKFYKNLTVSCSLASEGIPCWEKIRQENQIPESVKIAPPVCQKDSKALVAVEAIVKDLGQGELSFLGGKAICTASP